MFVAFCAVSTCTVVKESLSSAPGPNIRGTLQRLSTSAVSEGYLLTPPWWGRKLNGNATFNVLQFEIDGLLPTPNSRRQSAKQERKRRSANCELHLQKEMTALSPEAGLEALSESTQEFCYLYTGRNVFQVQRKPKDQRAQELAVQDRQGTDHGSWINAAPRWDEELLSPSGVIYMLCLKQPQGIRGSSGARLFLKVTLHKIKQAKSDQSDKGFPWRHANRWCLVSKLHSLAL